MDFADILRRRRAVRSYLPDQVCVVTVGKPAPEPRLSSTVRGWKPLDEVVRWERW
jgi:hypothetical protein